MDEKDRLPVGTRVRWSDSALRPKRDRVGTYGGSQGERLKREYETARAKRGTIVAHAFAREDNLTIMRKAGDFIGYDVKFDGETGIHQTMPHMVTRADD